MSMGATAEYWESISQKLDAVLAFLAVRGIEGNQSAIVERLSGAGFSRKTISLVSGLTENAVEIRLRRAKKSSQKAPKNPAGE